MTNIERCRCGWVTDEPLYQAYHDQEWGVPIHNDAQLFEFLTLEGAQAGLSWLTVLRKRENYRTAFDGFNAEKIARYDEDKIAQLLTNPGIIRNRLKVNATVQNAREFLRIQQDFGSFDAYIWQFVNGKTKVNQWQQLAEIPTETVESQAMSRDLRQRGFKFVGSTICYAFMQACGLVNDHTTNCFRYSELLSAKS